MKTRTPAFNLFGFHPRFIRAEIRVIRVPLLLTTLFAAPALAQEDARLRGQSDQTYKRLVEAKRKLTSGKPADAADDLQRILDEAGDDLVLASQTDLAYRPARQVAQRVFAELPADALRGYRDRTDGPARRLLDAGKAARDPRPLKSLIDHYFASRQSEEGLLLLGELAFERGEFRAAEGHWRRLLPAEDAAADPSYPDPKTGPAAVRAKVTLALIFQGDATRAKAELARLRTEHPTAAGRLAGKDGPFAATLQALLDRPPVLAAEATGDGEWTSFAGTAARDGRATGRLPYYWPARPTWTVAIPPDDSRDKTVLPRVAPARAVGFHPVVLNGVAYIADPVRVFGFDLMTGAQRFAYDLRGDLAAARVADVRVPLPLTTDADFTMTAGGGKLFARLGVPAMTAPPQNNAGRAGLAVSFLVGFAPPEPQAPGNPPLEVAWKLPPPSADGAAATWEGAPLWADGRLYAAIARFDQTRTIHAIACYDDPPGKPLWVTDVADGPPPKTDEPRHRHELLTLAGDALVFCTHTGVIAAVDARTGKPAWGMKYPKAARSPANPSVRDLSPPLASDGRVFVAPADADKVFALDAATGRPLWNSVPMQVEQLLGVTRGRLVCTVAQPTRGIRALNVATGSDREPDGWAVHDDPQLGSFGRGLVSDDLIVWPTKAALFLLNPTDGTMLRPPVRGPHGNLAFADGVVLVATPTQVWGYVADRKDLPARTTARADDPEGQRRLALALADAGQWDEADAAIRRAEPAADVGRVRAEWLTDRAERAVTAGRDAEARGLLRQMLGDEFPPSWRARAVARLASLEPPGGGDKARQRFAEALKLPRELNGELVFRAAAPPVDVNHVVAGRFGVLLPPKAPPDDFPAPAAPVEPGVHRFGPNASVTAETRFPSDRFVPLRPFAGCGLPGLGRDGPDARLLVTDGSAMLGYRPGESRLAWEARLPAGLAVTHAVEAGPVVVAAGPHGAVGLSLADGQLGWAVRIPDADPLPGAGSLTPVRSPDVPADAALSDFALAGSLLVARYGAHHLLAVDVRTGAVAWAVDSAGRPRLAPVGAGPRFDPHFLADDAGVIARLSTGRRLSVSPRGIAADGPPTTAVEWESPPARLGRSLVAVPDGPTLLHGIRRGDGAIAWTYDAGRVASATGRPPKLRALPGGLVVAVARNHGVELDLLQADAGSREWASRPPALIPAGDADLAAADHDGDALYVPADGRVYAVRLSDGTVLWSAETGPGRWHIRAGRTTVLAYPAEAVPTDPPATSAAAFLRAPAVGRLPALAAAAYDAWTARTVPVLVLDRATGAVRRRLDLPAIGPAVGVHVGGETAVVVTAGKAYWLK